MQGPLTREGMLRFYERDRVITSIPEGRIFFATGRGNAEFSTPVFKMPNGGLSLEADVRFKPYEDETGLAYLMAELRNADGETLPGYERQNCLLDNVDARNLKLKWGDKTGSEFGGEEVRLRFYFRDAKNLFPLRS